MNDSSFCLVLSGGGALGSYEAGVWEALQSSSAPAAEPVRWIASSSVGTVNAALIAGSAPERRRDTLAEYWLAGSAWQAEPLVLSGSLRHASNWLNAAQARLWGSPRHLRPGGSQSFYDLGPTVDFLKRKVDFGRLNSGDVRLTVATVDIESGDPVLFDTARGTHIGIDHLLASCGFFPEFAPVEFAGRLLGDGGLAWNAPVEPVLDELEGEGGTVFVVDLYARDGARPSGIESSLVRKNGLMFGNQTWTRLDLYRRLWQRHGIAGPQILYLSYLPNDDEAGPEASFDFSRASGRDRWQAGMLDAAAALARLDSAHSQGDILTAIRRHNLQERSRPARAQDSVSLKQPAS